jgi:hypothetical protein
VKYGSARKCRRKFRRKFRDERVPSRQTVHSLVIKRGTAGLLIDKKQKRKLRMLTEEKLDDVEVRLATFVITSNPTKWQRLQT